MEQVSSKKGNYRYTAIEGSIRWSTDAVLYNRLNAARCLCFLIGTGAWSRCSTSLVSCHLSSLAWQFFRTIARERVVYSRLKYMYKTPCIHSVSVHVPPPRNILVWLGWSLWVHRVLSHFRVSTCTCRKNVCTLILSLYAKHKWYVSALTSSSRLLERSPTSHGLWTIICENFATRCVSYIVLSCFGQPHVPCAYWRRSCSRFPTALVLVANEQKTSDNIPCVQVPQLFLRCKSYSKRCAREP